MAILRLNSVWTGSTGSPYFTQTYYTGAADVAHADDAINALYTLFNAMSTYIDDALTVTISGDAEVIDVSNGQITSVVSTTGAVKSFTGTGDALPTLVQGLAVFNTGSYINGRQLKGHMYLPGMLEANNTVVGLPAASMTSTITGFLTTYAADSSDPTVFSRTHGAASTIQSSSMSAKWAYLRSRRD